MASIIKIKRSDTTGGAPGTLASGELAYSALAGDQSNGGDRLYIGVGAESAGNASGRHVVGGKYFTDMLDHTKGTLTASSAIVVDANSKIDNLKVDDLDFNGNVISASGAAAATSTIVFTPKGNSALTIVQSGTASTPYEDLVLIDNDIPNKKYVDDLLGSQNSLDVQDESDAIQTVNFSTDNLKITGGEGIDTAVTKVGNLVTLTVSGEDATAAALAGSANKGISSYSLTGFDVVSGFVTLKANVPQSVSTDGSAATPALNAFTIAGGQSITTSGSGATVTIDATLAIASGSSLVANAGVASFDTANFEVDANGWVGIKDAGVSNAELVNSTITLGSSTLTLGATTTDIAGLTSLVVDDLTIDGSTISALSGTGSNINIVLTPKGTGVIDVSNAQIVNVANPTQSQHAATKAYVDAVKTGLDIKDSVRVATTAALTITPNGTGVGKTLTNAGTLAAINIDSIPLALGDRVLVKDQDGGSSADNGIYTVTTVGTASVPWVLTRATDADQNPNTPGFSEVTAGLFTFVEEGTINQDSGWVLNTDNPIVIDTTPLSFTQFSGAGSVDAGDGLSRTGTTLNVGEGDGILVTADHVSVNTSIAGDGLSATTGGTYGGATSLQVVGTADRITVSSSGVDIASTYLGQTSITTLGTIATGTWQGTVITVPYGGTGLSTATANGIIYGNGVNALGVTVAGTWDSANSVGQFLSVNSSQVPTWTNTIDGGTY